MSDAAIAALLLIELTVILVVARVVVRLVQPLGQPPVVGEMIAGVLLGPSLLGWLWPELQAQLFPKPALTVVHALAQLGLIFYMFLVGLEFDLDLLSRRARSAVAVSWAGMLAPFAIGGLLGAWLAGDARLFGSGVTRGQAALFMGAAMSITAFPMLARIIRDAGLSRTSLGTLALAAGSLDDAAAWCALALVLANFQGAPDQALLAIGGGVALSAVLLVVVRPCLRRWAERVASAEAWERWGLPGALVLLLASAWCAERVGVHAVFGAFMTGVAMPRGLGVQRLEAQLGPLTGQLLVPLFFVSSGLNTHIGLLATPEFLGLALVVLLGACLGKGGACYLAARQAGESRRDAVAIGALMNARGLMELILLDIGLSRGIVTPTLFAVMVLMAVVTTLAATPVFRRVYRPDEQALEPAAGAGRDALERAARPAESLRTAD